MKTLIELFNLGMMRNYLDIIPDAEGLVLNLGPGSKHIKGAVGIGLPEWNANVMDIPYEDNSVDMIHCYHFLEHIQSIVYVMNQIERVLKKGAHINIVVPYYSSMMQANDLDHRHSFTEKTFQHLFSRKYYDTGKAKPMEICTNLIMGDDERNLALVTQLRKM